MNFIGCDPGKSGALAVISPDGVMVVPFDENEYFQTLRYLKPMESICCLERVGAMPKQGVTAMFNFGFNYGWIHGLLYGLGIPTETVRPNDWKKKFGVTADKNTSIDVCKKLFPGVSLRRSDRGRVDNDGMAEALLLAKYAERYFWKPIILGGKDYD